MDDLNDEQINQLVDSLISARVAHAVQSQRIAFSETAKILLRALCWAGNRLSATAPGDYLDEPIELAKKWIITGDTP